MEQEPISTLTLYDENGIEYKVNKYLDTVC
jgi:hypothetical protein